MALRDHLHLLAQLSIPEHQHPDSLVLSRIGLAHCFTHLADTADHIVAAIDRKADTKSALQPCGFIESPICVGLSVLILLKRF